MTDEKHADCRYDDKHAARLRRERRHFEDLEFRYGPSRYVHALRTTQPRLRRRREEALKCFSSLSGERCLEMGCAMGEYTAYIVKSPLKLVSIDLSGDLLRRVRQRLAGAPVTFLAADAEKLPFKDNSFSAVTGNAILHHLNVDVALPEIYRILRPGGKLFFSEPNMLNPHIFLERTIPFLRKISQSSPDETAFTHWQMRRALSAAGFKNIKVEPFDFVYPFLPQRLINLVDKMGDFLETIPVLRHIAGSLLIKGEK